MNRCTCGRPMTSPGSILSGASIKEHKILQPCVERGVKDGMSYGLSHASYDVRIAQDTLIKPGDFVLASTMEYFNMPNDVAGFVHDKSTWARKGLSAFNTFIDPAWRGYLTLELVNHSDRTFMIERGTPIAQIVFQWMDKRVVGYSGKYQNQEDGPVEARDECATD